MSRIGTKILWPYKCSLCGKGFGNDDKLASMAYTFSVDRPERSYTDVQLCDDCLLLPIAKLGLHQIRSNRNKMEE